MRRVPTRSGSSRRPRWAEWNGRYRDDIRRFWRGDPGCTGALATRLTGSSDLYLRDGRKPFHSINFMTSHDGFTLNDLVSYAQRHNEENGEGGPGRVRARTGATTTAWKGRARIPPSRPSASGR